MPQASHRSSTSASIGTGTSLMSDSAFVRPCQTSIIIKTGHRMAKQL